MPRYNPYAYPDKWTDLELKGLEMKIRDIYTRCSKDLDKITQEYWQNLIERDKLQQQYLANGDITPQQYRDWRLAQQGRGKRFEALRDKLADIAADANAHSRVLINEAMPAIYAENRNYSAYAISGAHPNVNYLLYDESTVRRLLISQPDLMPYYPEERALDRGIDVAYGKRQITSVVTSGIIRGVSVQGIAGELRDKVTNMNYTSSIRAARTAATGAQNAGRIDTYIAAEQMGIKLHKEWMSTLDGRTRHTHQDLDGESIPVKDTFWNGCAFPGDPDGPPEEVYNCRCTLIADLDDVKAKPRQTYREWREMMQTSAAPTASNSEITAATGDDLKNIDTSAIIKIQNGFSAFPPDTEIARNVRRVKPYRNYYDVALHGAPNGVCLGTDSINCSSTLLAKYIRSREDYHGQPIRLLACNTGSDTGLDRNFAENLSNALNTVVIAPNKELHITRRGIIYIGEYGEGEFVRFTPNIRRRYGG